MIRLYVGANSLSLHQDDAAANQLLLSYSNTRSKPKWIIALIPLFCNLWIQDRKNHLLPQWVSPLGLCFGLDHQWISLWVPIYPWAMNVWDGKVLLVHVSHPCQSKIFPYKSLADICYNRKHHITWHIWASAPEHSRCEVMHMLCLWNNMHWYSRAVFTDMRPPWANPYRIVLFCFEVCCMDVRYVMWFCTNVDLFSFIGLSFSWMSISKERYGRSYPLKILKIKHLL